jgi:hypothetical protein
MYEISAVRIVEIAVITLIFVPDTPSAIELSIKKGINNAIRTHVEFRDVSPVLKISADEVNNVARCIPIGTMTRNIRYYFCQKTISGAH